MSKTTQKSENERRRAAQVPQEDRELDVTKAERDRAQRACEQIADQLLNDPLIELLLAIQEIVHQPTARKEPALHHFQRDFDAIRALCEKGVGKYRRLT